MTVSAGTVARRHDDAVHHGRGPVVAEQVARRVVRRRHHHHRGRGGAGVVLQVHRVLELRGAPTSLLHQRPPRTRKHRLRRGGAARRHYGHRCRLVHDVRLGEQRPVDARGTLAAAAAAATCTGKLTRRRYSDVRTGDSVGGGGGVRPTRQDRNRSARSENKTKP